MMALNQVGECISHKALWRQLMSIKFAKLEEFSLFGLLTGLLCLIIKWVEILIKFKLLADILLRCGKPPAWIFQMLDFYGRQMKLIVVLKNIGLVWWISAVKIILQELKNVAQLWDVVKEMICLPLKFYIHVCSVLIFSSLKQMFVNSVLIKEKLTCLQEITAQTL